MIAPPARAIEVAREAATRSPCKKSKRGAVLFWSELARFPTPVVREATAAFNGPPNPWICDGSPDCRDLCGKTCVHAEARCISSALAQGVGNYNGKNIDRPDDLLYYAGNYDLVHVKVVGPIVVPGGPPSCVACSKAILEFGVGGVWLYEKQLNGEGQWHRYSREEFHRESLLGPGNVHLLAAERLVR